MSLRPATSADSQSSAGHHDLDRDDHDHATTLPTSMIDNLKVLTITLPTSSHLNPDAKSGTGPGSWSLWSRTLRSSLEEDHLDILDGLRSQPPPDSPLYKHWQRDNTAIRRAIVASTTASIHVVDENERNSKTIYDTLQRHYAPSDTETTFRTVAALFDLRLESATEAAFTKWETEYRSLARDIESKKIDISDLITMKIFLGLPDSLSSIRTATLVRSIDSAALPSREKCIEIVRSAVLSADQHNATALLSSSKNPKSTSRNRPKQSSNGPPDPCWACQSTQHEYRNCPDQKKRQAYVEKVKAIRLGKSSFVSALAVSDDDTVSVTEDSFVAWHSGLTQPDSIILDSGASHHLTGDKDALRDFKSLPHQTLTGIGKGASITGVGKVALKLSNGVTALVSNVFFVQGLPFTLLSAGRLYADRAITSTFDSSATLAKDGKVIATGRRLGNNLYALNASVVSTSGKLRSPIALAVAPELILWHTRYAHLGVNSLKMLARSGLVPELQPILAYSPHDLQCDSCVIGKAKASPFTGKHERDSEKLGRVHSDLLTMNVPSRRGLRYILTFVDDFSRKLWIYLLAAKSEVPAKFKAFKAMVELESGHKIKILHTDNGGEYMSNAFQEYLTDCGIHHSLTIPHTPQMNGIAERVNRTIVEGIITVLSASGLPNDMWGEAAYYVTAVKNLSPHAGIDNDVPARVWSDRMPSVMPLKPFGCKAFAREPKPSRKKLDPKAKQLIFVGFDLNAKAWRLWDPSSAPRKPDIVISRDVTFIEDNFPFLTDWALGGGRILQRIAPPSVRALDSSDSVSVDLLINTAPSTSERAPPLDRGARDPAVLKTPPMPAAMHTPDAPARARHDTPDTSSAESSPSPSPVLKPQVVVTEATPISSPRQQVADPPSSPDPLDMLSPCDDAAIFFASVFTADPAHPAFELASQDPKNWRAAMQDKDSELWRKEAIEEYRSLRDDYRVFDEVPASSMPAGAKLVGSRFVFARKWNADGDVTGYKARLVAQGFSQREGVDFNETFAPVATMTSVRTVIATAAMEGYVLEQTDVNKAYLHGDLDEEIWMRLPEGIKHTKPEGTVLKLRKALYGLKQAGRAWNAHLKASLLALGFEQCVSDTCLYRRKHSDGSIEYLLAYVDDLLHAARTSDMIAKTKQGLKLTYGLKEPGRAEYLLGIQIKHNSDGSIFISQKKYINDVLARFDMSACHPTKAPMKKGLVLPEPDKSKINQELKTKYLSAVGSLMYASTSTRPDIAFAVGYLARFSASPSDEHWQAVKTVLRYLKGTAHFGILYHRNGPGLTGEFHVPRPRDELVAYSDTDWAGCPHTSKSTSGYVFTLAGGPISWSSKLQPRVTLSSVEAEYLGLSHCAKETINLRQLRQEMGFAPTGPTVILGDNTGAMALARDPVKASRVRHVRLPEHHVRETVREGLAIVKYVPTSQMAADIFTKPLGPELFLAHRARLVTAGGV